MTAKGVPTPIDATIRSAIDTYPNGLLGTLATQSDPLGRGSPLVIKYIPAKFAMGYQTAKTTQLRISDTAGFTWGDGTYVSPLAFPISTAVFGRVGVVAKFDPAGWRVFDATTDQHQSYYLQWASRQPLFRRATLTALSPYYNRELRNLFRIAFDIDCVLFPPDQSNSVYNDSGDVWMNVTDWAIDPYTSDPKIATGYSTQFTDTKISAIIEDEFYDDLGGTLRKAMLAFTTTKPSNGPIKQSIAQSYAGPQKPTRVRA
jgi:hypothetical protein